MINEKLKDLLSFKGKGVERSSDRQIELDSLGFEIDELSQVMEVLTCEFKNTFNMPWSYYLYLRKHAGRMQILWRRGGGINGNGQSMVKYEDSDFSKYRKLLSESEYKMFVEFELYRLKVNFLFYMVHNRYEALRRYDKQCQFYELNGENIQCHK